MKYISFVIALSLPSLLIGGPIALTNPSFEADVLPDNTVANPVIGWTATVGCCGVGAYNPTTSGYASGTSIDGANLAYSNGAPHGFYQQVLSNFQPNTTYTFTMMVGHRLDVSFGGYQLQIRDSTNLSLPALASLVGSADPGAGQWSQQSISYTTGATGSEIGQAIVVRFGSNGDGIQTNFDQATLTSATPEPATFGVLAASLIAIGWRRTRRA